MLQAEKSRTKLSMEEQTHRQGSMPDNVHPKQLGDVATVVLQPSEEVHERHPHDVATCSLRACAADGVTNMVAVHTAEAWHWQSSLCSVRTWPCSSCCWMRAMLSHVGCTTHLP